MMVMNEASMIQRLSNKIRFTLRKTWKIASLETQIGLFNTTFSWINHEQRKRWDVSPRFMKEQVMA